MRHLRREGVTAGRHRIRRLMAVMGMEATYRRPRTAWRVRSTGSFPISFAASRSPGRTCMVRGHHLCPCDARVFLPGHRDGLGDPARPLLAVVQHHGHLVLHRGSGRRAGPRLRRSITDQGSQGEFKRSSQRRCCDGSEQAPRSGSSPTSTDASPGRPPVGRREHRQRFWKEIARGLSEEAAVAAGVSPARDTLVSRVVACHHSIFVPSHGAISRSLSEKRSPFFEPVVVACARSPGSWAAHPRRSRENCGATQLQEEGTSSIGPRPLNGTPTGERNVQSLRSSLRTAN